MNPRVVALVALIVLAAGLAVWLSAARPPAVRVPAPGAAPEPDSGVIARALQSVPTDSAAIKSRWIDDLNGMDLSKLSPEKRTLFLRYANSERCTCGCGYTLSGCRQSDMDCDVSGPHLAALLDSVRAGRIRNANGLRQPPSRGDAVDDD